MVKVKIKKLHPDAVIPKYASEGASGFDLVAVEDVFIEPGETKLVRTGLAFEIPEGYELQIRPRSGISKNTKLRISNSPGTVDADYRGEVAVIIDNIAVPRFTILTKTDGCFASLRIAPLKGCTVRNIQGNVVTADRFVTDHTYFIRKGDRIAQGVIVPVIRAEFEEVEELSPTARGSGGFGSTGVR